VAYDSVYDRIIVAYETESTQFNGALLETKNTWQPLNAILKNWNVAIVAYPTDCIIFLIKNTK